MPKYPVSFFANNLFYLIADYFGCVIIIKLLAKHDINIKNNQGLDVFKERRCQQQHYQGSPEYSKLEARVKRGWGERPQGHMHHKMVQSTPRQRGH